MIAGFAATAVLSALMILKGMMGLMPMAGAGLFGLSPGIMAPVITLMLHVIFGVVLGLVFQTLPDEAGTASHARSWKGVAEPMIAAGAPSCCRGVRLLRSLHGA
jgi:hypothetical protein